MVKYIDRTDTKHKSLEISFVGMDESNNTEEIPETTDVSVRLLERKPTGIADTPYIECWTKKFQNIVVPRGVWNGIKLGELTNTKVFAALGNSICEINSHTGEINWLVSYLNTAIRTIKLTNNGDGIFVLHDGYQLKIDNLKSNLIKINLDGNLLWSAETTMSNDVFSGLFYSSEGLSGYTWNGWSLQLNEDTGRVKEDKFVK